MKIRTYHLVLLLAFVPMMLSAQSVYEQNIKVKSKASTVNVAVPLYKTGDWSAWQRKEGVEYRYRWGMNTQAPQYQTQIDAIYEVRNISNRLWEGAARSLKCDAEQISGFQKQLKLQPNEVQTVKFLTPNCGTVAKPYFRPNIVKSVRFD